jgi:hypothetical protein
MFQVFKNDLIQGTIELQELLVSTSSPLIHCSILRFHVILFSPIFLLNNAKPQLRFKTRMPTHLGNYYSYMTFAITFKRLPWNVIVNGSNGSCLMTQGWWGPAQAAKN